MRIDLSRIRFNGSAPSREQVAALANLKDQLPALLAKPGLSAKSVQAIQRVFTDGKPRAGSDVLAEEFTIVGVVRLSNRDDEERWDPVNQITDVLLPVQTATEMYFKVPRQAEQGINATLIVDQESNVDGVVQQIRA